jgi:hypothetical protein
MSAFLHLFEADARLAEGQLLHEEPKASEESLLKVSRGTDDDNDDEGINSIQFFILMCCVNI